MSPFIGFKIEGAQPFIDFGSQKPDSRMVFLQYFAHRHRFIGQIVSFVQLTKRKGCSKVWIL